MTDQELSNESASPQGAINDPELNRQIETALDTIRPYLEADGGAVRLLNVTSDMVVELELLGACGTCPMSTMTLRAGIEQAIMRAIPSITRVEAVSTTAT
ncbi:MAG: NifU family protein [Rhodothermaceae bacterium]|nr:NifU family protein [Rhodothermaceae bacterium]